MNIIRRIAITLFAAVCILGQLNAASVLGMSSLPEVLKATDGTQIKYANQWYNSRQQEIVDLLERDAFGIPSVGRPANLSFNVTDTGTANSGGTRMICTISYSGPGGSNSLQVLLWLPPGASASNPVPCVIMNNHRSAPNPSSPSSSFYPVSTILARGYATMHIDNRNTDPDSWSDFFSNGVHKVFDPQGGVRDPHAWGTLRAWAWGISRGIDWLETIPAIDINRIATTGHSRSGKTALIAAAFDERVSLAIPNNAGTFGPSIARTIDKVSTGSANTSFPHWMNNHYKRYSQEPYMMDFDHHWLVACVAPRRVYIGCSSGDTTEDVYSSFNSAVEAGPVYDLLGLSGLGTTTYPAPSVPIQTGSLAYHVKTASHSMNTIDWNFYMNYMDKIWSNVSATQEANVEKGTTKIADGGSYTDDTLEAGQTRYIPFAIRNHGRQDLTITGQVSVVGTNCTVSVVSPPASTVKPDRATTVGLEVTPTNAGAWSVAVVMNNNDPNEGVYNWTVQGTATTHTPAPKMRVYYGDYEVSNGGGSYVVNSEELVNTVETYIIKNEGDATLTISDATLSGQSAVNSTVAQQPAQSSLAPGQSTTFKLNVNPKIPSPWDVDIAFTTNDPTASTFGWKTHGISFVTELVITREGVEIPNNSADTIQGLMPGVATDITYMVGSVGASGRIVPVLPYRLITSNCTASITVQPGNIIGANTADPMTIRVTPAAMGAWSVEVNFGANDYDEYAVKWTMQGSAGTLPSGSEISLTRNSAPVNDGGADTVTGSVAGEPQVLIYTINNTGADPLLITNPVSVSGTDCVVSVTQAPASSVASLGNTQLEIAVTPSSVGAWSGTVSIVNNDSNENPYNFSISGTASTPNLDIDPPSSFTATPNSGGGVTLSWVNEAADGEGYVIERREVSATNTFEVILDDGDTGVTNLNFSNMTFGSGYYQNDCLNAFAAVGSTLRVRYTPDLGTESGDYEVYVYYSNEAKCTNVPVTVTENGVARVVILDQTQNYDQWYKLGDFNLSNGDYLEYTADFLPNPTGGTQRVLADGVRFFRPVSGGPWSTVATFGNAMTETYTDTTTEGETAYEYRIRATSSITDGLWSDSVSVLTLAEDVTDQTYTSWSAGLNWNSGDSSRTADPDKDGFANLIEYALSGNPTASNGALFEHSYRRASGESKLVLTFVKNRLATDARIIVETSADMVSWTQSHNFAPGADITSGSNVNVLGTFPSSQNVEVIISLSASVKFVRLRVKDN